MSHQAHNPDSETTFFQRNPKLRKHGNVAASWAAIVYLIVQAVIDHWPKNENNSPIWQAIREERSSREADEKKLAALEQRAEDERDSHTKPNHIKP